jgi:hypothetical protein
MEKQRFHSFPCRGRRISRLIGRSLAGRVDGRAAKGVTACAAALALALVVSGCRIGDGDAQAPAAGASALPDYAGSCGCNKEKKRESYARAMQEGRSKAE